MPSLTKKIKSFLNLLPVFHNSKVIEPSSELHQLYRRSNQLVYQDRPVPFRGFLRLFAYSFWYIYALLLILIKISRRGKMVKKWSGKTYYKQFTELLYLSYWHFVPPKSYYYHRLWDQNSLERAPFLLTTSKLIGALSYINKPEHKYLINDKFAFFKFCQEHQIPSPEIFAYFDKGTINWVNSEIKKVDLVFKERFGFKSSGLSDWIHENGNYLNQQTNATNTLDEMLSIYQQQSKVTPYVLQERLTNHETLRPFGNNRLATIRTLTVKSSKGPAEVIHSVLRLPTLLKIRGEEKNGELLCSLNQESGEVIRAFNPNFKDQLTKHPVTHLNFNGIIIPFWDGILNTALKAHQHIDGIPLIGWDIAVTNDGFFFLEGNLLMELDLHQLPIDKPLGQTSLVERLLPLISKN